MDPEKKPSPATIEQDNPSKASLLKLVKQHRKIVIWCLGLSSCILLYGYDLIIVGTISAVPAFQRDFGETINGRHILPSMWLALWNAFSPLGIMIGAIIGGWLQNSSGRRASLAAGSVVSIISVAVMYVADLPEGDALVNTRRGIFLGAKTIQGIGIGTVISTTQTYMSEILPPELRGPILAFFPIFTLLGQLIGAGVIFGTLGIHTAMSYKIPFATQWPISVGPLLLSIFMPESPPWLISKSRHGDALKAQKRLHHTELEGTATFESLVTSIDQRRRQEANNGFGYISCFKGVNRRRSLIVMFANTLPALWGLTLLSKASYFMQVVGMRANYSVVFLMVGIVLGMASNVGSLWTLNFFGRRLLCLASLSVTTVIWLGMGIAGIFRNEVTPWYSAISMMLAIVVCGLGVWPAAYAVAAEASALELRALTQGIGWFTNGSSTAIFALVLPYIFNPDAGDLGAMTGFVYSGLCLLGLIVTWFFIPEMKSRSQTELDNMFDQRLAARAFKKQRL